MNDDGATFGTRLFRLSTGVFFAGGFVASIVNLLVPRLRTVLGLDYAAATSIQLASHSGYLMVAVPVAAFVSTVGYMRGHAAGLGLMSTGLAALSAGLWSGSLAIVVMALVAISSGATFLQIASNTVITVVGDPDRAATRLNVLQGLNSAGTVLGPLLGATFVLAAGGERSVFAALPFMVGSVLTGWLAGAFWRSRNLLGTTSEYKAHARPVDWIEAARDRRLRFGLLTIFAYVGAEVTIGALLPSFLMLPDVMGVEPVEAGQLVGFYWGAAMVGRFAGAFALRHMRPGTLLMGAAVGAMTCGTFAILGHGPAAAVALLLVGLFNSVMYPTIYVLALPRTPRAAIPGSTMLCMAVVGGAIVPFLTGMIADRFNLAFALTFPVACYLVVAGFAIENGARGLWQTNTAR